MRGRRGLLILVIFIILSVSVSANKESCNFNGGIWCSNIVTDNKCVPYEVLDKTNNNLVCKVNEKQYLNLPDIGTPLYRVYFNSIEFANGAGISFRTVEGKNKVGASKGGDGGSKGDKGGNGGGGGSGGANLSFGNIGTKGDPSKDGGTILGKGGAGGKISGTIFEPALTGAKVYLIAQKVTILTSASITVNGVGGQDYSNGKNGHCYNPPGWTSEQCGGGGGGAGGSGAGILYMYVAELVGSGTLKFEAKGGDGGDGGKGGSDAAGMSHGNDDGGGGGAGGGGDGGEIHFFVPLNKKEASVTIDIKVNGGTSGSAGEGPDTADWGDPASSPTGKDGIAPPYFSQSQWDKLIEDELRILLPESGFGSGACSDGIDNNGNGKVDMQDVSCHNMPAEDPEGICPDRNGPITFSDSMSNLLLSVEDASALSGKDGCCGDDAGVCSGTGSDCTLFRTNKAYCLDAGCTVVEGTNCISKCWAADESSCDDMSDICLWDDSLFIFNCKQKPSTPDCAYECNTNYCNWFGFNTVDVCIGEFSCDDISAENTCLKAGCEWDGLSGDLFYFDSDAKYFCSKDYDAVDGKILDDLSGDWKWWDADGEADSYMIHTMSFDTFNAEEVVGSCLVNGEWMCEGYSCNWNTLSCRDSCTIDLDCLTAYNCNVNTKECVPD